MDRSKRQKRAPLLVVVVALGALALAAGCTPREDTTPVDGAAAGLEQWKCGDRVTGCGFLVGKCLVTLSADLRDGTGTVSFDGLVDRTKFLIQGIERRWNWCLTDNGTYDCAFIIAPDGSARYIHFAGSVPDSDGRVRAKPTERFKCTKS